MRIFVILFIVCCMGCAGSSRYSFRIKGNIDGIKYGKAFLIAPGDSLNVLYSTDIEGGKFLLAGELDEPGQYILRVNRRQFYFFMDGKNMEINVPYSSFGNESLKGSPANELNAEYDQLMKAPFLDVRNTLLDEYRVAMEAGDQKLADEKMTEALKTDEIQYRLTKEFVQKHPDNIYSAYISDIVKGESHEKGKELYELLSSKNQASDYGRLLKEHTDALAVSALGGPCPDFTVTDESGNKVSLASQKGEILVLDFWASWCGPCRQEMKNLREQYDEFKDRGVHFMSISMDDSIDKWKKACEEEQIPWISTRDDNGWSKSEIRGLFGIQSIPFIVLLDKDGNIVAKNIRRNSLREKIVELLQK